jgi:hypothetical protein
MYHGKCMNYLSEVFASARCVFSQYILFDTIHLPFLLDTEEIPKDPSAGSGFGLALDQPGYLIPTTHFYGTAHGTNPGAVIPCSRPSMSGAHLVQHMLYDLAVLVLWTETERKDYLAIR